MRKPIQELRQDIIFSANLRGHNFTFHTTWGLFSPQHVDKGSGLLLDYIAIPASATVLDVGCGYGAIGLPLAKLSPAGKIHMVDSNFVAVEYAKKNVSINKLTNCKVYLSNLLSQVPDLKFDCIVSNLPAKAERELFDILLIDAKEHLKPGGVIYLVSIIGL